MYHWNACHLKPCSNQQKIRYQPHNFYTQDHTHISPFLMPWALQGLQYHLIWPPQHCTLAAKQPLSPSSSWLYKFYHYAHRFLLDLSTSLVITLLEMWELWSMQNDCGNSVGISHRDAVEQCGKLAGTLRMCVENQRPCCGHIYIFRTHFRLSLWTAMHLPRRHSLGDFEQQRTSTSNYHVLPLNCEQDWKAFGHCSISVVSSICQGLNHDSVSYSLF